LTYGRELEGGRSISVFHLSVVLEKTHIIGRRFDAKYEAELVVHLDRHRSHVVLDPRSLDARAKVIAEFILIMPCEFATEKRRDMVCFDGMNGCPSQSIIQPLEVFGTSKHDVRGVFDLHEAPVIAQA